MILSLFTFCSWHVSYLRLARPLASISIPGLRCTRLGTPSFLLCVGDRDVRVGRVYGIVDIVNRVGRAPFRVGVRRVV